MNIRNDMTKVQYTKLKDWVEGFLQNRKRKQRDKKFKGKLRVMDDRSRFKIYVIRVLKRDKREDGGKQRNTKENISLKWRKI